MKCSSDASDDKSNGGLIASAYMNNYQNILAKGKEPSMTKEYKPKVAYQFEKYLNPSSLKRHVMRSEKVQKIIAIYAKNTNCAPKEIEEQVKQIVDEIGLDRNMAIIRWCGVAITAIGKRISSGIYVNEENLNKVKAGLGRNPVLYLPSHRSYLDFILMSYICFHYDIEIPGIAAGMDFHSMFGMGTMLRKTGAFFMRRSFSSDELYWDIFRAYMYALVANYHIGLEFFIEGTRSRNFKALVPKVGLLSMALLPFFTGEVSDITIVPVSVSYERVLEEELFVYELLGIPKPKESTKGFFKALRVVEQRFGKMFLDFGEPISVREFFGDNTDRIHRAAVAAHMQSLNKREIELVKKLANEIIYQQQRRIVITTFNLLSLHYACRFFSGKTTSIDEVGPGVLLLKSMFEFLGAHVGTSENNIKAEIIETVKIHSNVLRFKGAQLCQNRPAPFQVQSIDIRRLKAHTLTPQTMSIVVPAFALQLYINPCMFWLARPAFLLIAAMQLKRENNEQAISTIRSSLAERVAELNNIFQNEFIIESFRGDEELGRNLVFLEKFGVMRISEKSHIELEENDQSSLILSSIAPFLCVYYQLTVTLNEIPVGQEFAVKEVLVRTQQRIECLLHQNNQTNVHPYCLALDNLSNALHSFVQSGFLTKNKDQMLCHFMTEIEENVAPMYNIKLHHLEDTLLQYCKLMPFTRFYESYNWDLMPAKL